MIQPGSLEFTVRGNRWSYFTVCPEISTSNFKARITCERSLTLFVRKGLIAVPDETNFDMVVKNEAEIVLHADTFNSNDGFIFAVYTKNPNYTEDYSFVIDFSFSSTFLQ